MIRTGHSPPAGSAAGAVQPVDALYFDRGQQGADARLDPLLDHHLVVDRCGVSGVGNRPTRPQVRRPVRHSGEALEEPPDSPLNPFRPLLPLHWSCSGASRTAACPPSPRATLSPARSAEEPEGPMTFDRCQPSSPPWPPASRGARQHGELDRPGGDGMPDDRLDLRLADLRTELLPGSRRAWTACSTSSRTTDMNCWSSSTDQQRRRSPRPLALQARQRGPRTVELQVIHPPRRHAASGAPFRPRDADD